MSDQPETRAGFIALAGATNVGKSTLLNRILRTGLAIASPKPQTTRTRLLGIHNEGSAQLVFIDTPGFMQVFQPPIDFAGIKQKPTELRQGVDISWVGIECQLELLLRFIKFPAKPMGSGH